MHLLNMFQPNKEMNKIACHALVSYKRLPKKKKKKRVVCCVSQNEIE